jgi:hypothetical protein
MNIRKRTYDVHGLGGLRARRTPHHKPAVIFHVGDRGQYATDSQSGEWFFKIDAERYAGPFPNRRSAAAAWRRRYAPTKRPLHGL